MMTLFMTRLISILLVSWAMLAAHATATTIAEADPGSIVAKLDAMRRPSASNLKMTFTLTTSDGNGQDRYSYVGLLRKDAGTLVLAEDGDQRGQKYLYTSNGYWLYAPRTHRPLRLTPLQTLRGQASIGDVSRLDIGDDYTATFAPKREAKIDGRDCLVIDLKAKSGDATYAAITLLVDKATLTPLQADLMVTSGRKLKTVLFGGIRELGGQPMITQLTYIDALDPGKRTVQEISAIEPAHTVAAMFQPQALPLED